ncbi:dUTP diphosphatase [Mangrovicoccus algicola]|uniref:Deoxyuridine 5'-triphosphate nucleotidohydrolase n=1 Tax=Mangrovicoccus algicola TaxID=2771008 RepID=A0A8J6YVZ6_9RHOB|nr:dUTP diphosphatase [Mangrovicoccus algicola]MBE3638647.1 dUTP diphosphatase [Mangrovicoccus algicola]
MNTLKFLRLAGNDLPLPAYATEGAAGMDLRACLPDGPVTIEPGKIALVPTGFAVELPPRTEMQIRPRSGLATKSAILVPNSPGTVDEDYRGEVRVALLNCGSAPFTVAHGERIAQAVIADVRRPDITEVDAVSETVRGAGGFGSTGTA